MGNKSKQYAVVDGKLEVTKTEEVVDVVVYDYETLVKQRESIISQKERDNAQRDLEILEIDELIQAAKDANIDNANAVVL